MYALDAANEHPRTLLLGLSLIQYYNSEAKTEMLDSCKKSKLKSKRKEKKLIAHEISDSDFRKRGYVIIKASAQRKTRCLKIERNSK